MNAQRINNYKPPVLMGIGGMVIPSPNTIHAIFKDDDGELFAEPVRVLFIKQMKSSDVVYEELDGYVEDYGLIDSMPIGSVGERPGFVGFKYTEQKQTLSAPCVCRKGELLACFEDAKYDVIALFVRTEITGDETRRILDGFAEHLDGPVSAIKGFIGFERADSDGGIMQELVK